MDNCKDISDFNLNKLKDKFFVYIAGKEKSGKTSLAIEILRDSRHCEVFYFIVSDKSYDSETFAFSEKKIIYVDELKLVDLNCIAKDTRKKIIIFDDGIDCLYDHVLRNENNTFKILFKLINLKNTSIIFVSQYFLFPKLSKLVDYLFLAQDDYKIIRRHHNDVHFIITYKNIVKFGTNLIVDKNSYHYYKYDNNTLGKIIKINCTLHAKLPNKLVI